ncbi:MAG: glycosyltransferase family 9 protein [Candidatus Omnitrophica bacterium]|nr:glycosyltransferase family 9 protein [Candidatus Omnitrophota bacterium]
MKILIINPFGIGDVLFSMPLIRAIRQAFPESWIGYLCNRRTEWILESSPHLNELFVYEKDDLIGLWRRSWLQGLGYLASLVKRIRGRRFDLVIDLSLGERYGLMTKLVGIPRRVGFDYRGRGRFLKERLAIDGYHDEHIVTYYRRLLQFLGITMVEDRLELPVRAEDAAWAAQWLAAQGFMDGRTLVGIVPAGGVSWGKDAPFRRWSLAGFAAAADALIERCRAQVILFGEASDRDACREVAHRMAQPAIDVSGQTTLGQFVALLARLDLVMCNDGGPLHLAVSQGVKTVSIFGPVDPHVYGPYTAGRGGHVVIAEETLPCRPCYHRFRLPPCPYERACLTMIRVDDVVAACSAALRSTEGVRGDAPAHSLAR